MWSVNDVWTMTGGLVNSRRLWGWSFIGKVVDLCDNIITHVLGMLRRGKGSPKASHASSSLASGQGEWGDT